MEGNSSAKGTSSLAGARGFLYGPATRNSGLCAGGLGCG